MIMTEFQIIVGKMVEWFVMIFDWAKQQHPIFQGIIFMPLAILVASIFFGFIGHNERSI